MYAKVLQDKSYYLLQLNIDQEIAREIQSKRCQHCGGRLHIAHYRRKPRGLPPGIDEEAWSVRYSFCCDKDGCRKRQTPTSVRFAGRRVWLASVIMVLSGACSSKLLQDFIRKLGVRRRTLRRWRRLWAALISSPFWKEHKTRLSKTAAFDLPESLVEEWVRFQEPSAALLSAQRFMAPGWNFYHGH